MVKECQNCKKDFTIEPEDFLFYEKIKVPPPTFCPECRFARRMIWRNERSLYKRDCDMCKKSIITKYCREVSFPVYCIECYRGDNWGAEIYAKEYDFSKPFFEQFMELFYTIPQQSLWQESSYNCEYSNYVYQSKNVYLGFSVLNDSESVYYSSNLNKSKQIIDSYNIADSELIYEGMGIVKNYNSQYSYWSSNCIDSNFVLECNNCSDCFGCVNLVNKKYCIFNEQYTEEDYKEKLKKFDMGSYSFVKKFKNKFWEFSLQFPRKYANIINSKNSSGDELRNSNNARKSFNCFDNENIKYAYRSPKAKDSMDIGYCYAELAYEHALSGSEISQNVKFIINGGISTNNIEYADYCKKSSNLFGCVGLLNKQYCILNKQYEKEEYFEMVEKIKKHMNDMPYIDCKGRVYKYGEFFPYELCPFGYNEAVINDHFPLTKEEIIERGYPYKEKIENKYIITLKAKDIPDNIKDVTDSILDEVIECEKSGKPFRITNYELEFYRRMNIPIPRLHPDERYKERLALRNPMKLWRRSCMKEGCNNEFETSYAPERPEIIYCEDCYKREIY